MSIFTQNSNDRVIAGWLLFCAFVIYGMIVLGGVTRLTGSGLSMVEWKPIMGVIPPLNQKEWEETFTKYQQFPEYEKVNRHFDVEEFKKIFIFEYSHRVLGRIIGILFLIPFLYFLFRKRISSDLSPKLWALFVLGGLQGLMGWYMVKSGLVDMPRVSQYRLTAHLGIAVVIYGYMLWVAFDLLFPKVNLQESHGVNQLSSFKKFSFALMCIIFLMILSGGLVAGSRAGFVYNTFPLMDGRFIPVGLYNMEPLWRNIFEDLTTVQFNHRIFAYIITLIVIVFFVMGMKRSISRRSKLGLVAVLITLVVQVILGISALLLIVPVSIAAAHQAGAIALFTAAIFTTHSLYSDCSEKA
ncbi:MAG: COX15/CtaA family protein [Cellvibrionaceae bacterium]